MEQQFSHDVFISFSFKDQSVADKIVNHLTNLYNISCWICTESIRAGENFRKDIAKAIQEANLVVLVQSKTSATSNEVSKEILYALKKGKMVKPFVIEDSQLSDELEFELSTTHYIDATKPELDDRIRDLAKDICRTLGKTFEEKGSGKKENTVAEALLSTPSVIPKKVFCGRESVLNEINDSFQDGERLLFLYGIGGIGKTQIAKQYAKRYKNNYDVIIYATYDGSLKDMIIAEQPFALEPELMRYTLSDGSAENDDCFFKRKLDKIKRLSNERTLIIIDNFDVESDPHLLDVADGKYNLLITTRCDYSRHFPTIKIDPLESLEDLKKVFFQNYDGDDVFEDDPDLARLIELVNRHTYTIELIAQHMENSGQTTSEMIEALEKEGILSINEEIRNSDMKTNVAYENLLKMFRLFSLSEEECRILMLLSLMPLEGVDIREFKEWAGLSSNKTIKDLANKSWVLKNTEGIALHSIIREVIKHELPANETNCAEFLDRFAEAISGTKVWHLRKVEKDRYATITKCVLAGFPEITPKTEALYCNAEGLMSFAVDPEYAAVLANRLCDYYQTTLGDKAYRTAWAYFKLGWLYAYNSQLPDALKLSYKWLTKANIMFKDVALETSEQKGAYLQTIVNLSKTHIRLYELSKSDEDYNLARQYAESAIEYSESNLSKGDPQYAKVAGSHWQLADALFVGGEYTEALAQINEAIDILIELYTENDSDTMFAFYRKAAILYAVGDIAEAKRLAEKSAVGYAEFFGFSHPNVYIIYTLWGDCCVKLQEYDEALRLYNRAKEIAEKIFTPDAEQLSDIRNKITAIKDLC